MGTGKQYTYDDMKALEGRSIRIHGHVWKIDRINDMQVYAAHEDQPHIPHDFPIGAFKEDLECGRAEILPIDGQA